MCGGVCWLKMQYVHGNLSHHMSSQHSLELKLIEKIESLNHVTPLYNALQCACVHTALNTTFKKEHYEKKTFLGLLGCD